MEIQKIIKANMQEVLESVQKIHKQRQKHRKKKHSKENTTEQKENDSEEIAIPENKTNAPCKDKKKLPTGGGNIFNHFHVSLQKDGENSVLSEDDKKTNAFEKMMAANKKPTEQPEKTEASDPSVEDEAENEKRKRKLLLQEWNEKKGGRKRKIDESRRDDWIKDQMNKRAKRLKKLLVSETTESTPEKDEKKTTKQSKRIKRTELKNEIETKIDSDILEDKEAHVKTNSPVKKRDGLLEYFSKVENTNEIVNTGLPKRRERRKKVLVECKKLIEVANEINSDENGTTTRRTRRSCTLQNTLTATESPRWSAKKEIKSELSEDSIIEIEENTEDEDYSDRKRTSSKKLAPMFIKSLPKPVTNPEVTKARQQFLMSGVPEKMRREIDKQKQISREFEVDMDIFPKISHVTQRAAITPLVDLTKVIRFIKEADNCFHYKNSEKFTDCKKQDFKKKIMPSNSFTALEGIMNKRDIIKNWKIYYGRFPTFKCYNQMREKYRFHSAIDSTLDTQEISESFVVTRQSSQKHRTGTTINEDEKPPPSAPNGELLFTDKYKPLLTEQVLVNLTPVNSLKEFLSSWSSSSSMNSDNFSGFTSEESNSSQFNTSSIVLLGPKSSGKSNAVFALANEMNFNVLEINAGMKRNGKKLLSDLHEATQSHQIRKKNQKELVTSNTFSRKSMGNKNVDIMRMSLILIEDADIIFENHDSGFIDAINTLASTSKRPLIIVAEDLNCSHLQRLIKQNSIVFNPPNPLSISKFLSVLALLENSPIDLNQILSLYLYNNKDLRKTINEMQFYIQSGGDFDRKDNSVLRYFAVPPTKKVEFLMEEIPNDPKLYMHKGFFKFFVDYKNDKANNIIPYPINFSGLWMNMKDIIPKASLSISFNNNFNFNKRKRRSKDSSTITKTKDNGLTAFSDFYDNISVAENISFIESQNKHRAPYAAVSLANEISHYIGEESLKINFNAQECSYNLYDDTQKECTSVLQSLQLVTSVKPSNQISTDYEPCLRAICRSELYRQEEERKGSRFYHHLRFMSQNFTSLSNDFQRRVCTIFQETSQNDKTILFQESSADS